jgi:sulfatase-modifying factor enzyme 1
MKTPPPAVFLAILLTTMGLHAEVRTFTSSAGTVIRGELLALKGDMVTIKKEDGQTLTLKLAAFSRADQAWLQSQTSATSTAVSTDPAKATKDAPFVNSLGMKFVPVPGTRVLFCTTLTRQSHYGQFTAETPGMTPPAGRSETGSDKISYPQATLSWTKAKAFCDWLSKRDGRAYRLPTDREWSVAVGIGGLEFKDAMPAELDGKLKGVYPWGSQWPPPDGFGNYCDEAYREFCKKNNYSLNSEVIKGYHDGEVAIGRVEAYKPNKFGLYDMGGNLWQWCEDWYDATKTQKLLRGGCWDDSKKERLLSSARWPNPPDFQETQTDRTGFRCVLERPSAKP